MVITMTGPFAAVCGAGAGFGVWVLVAAITGASPILAWPRRLRSFHKDVRAVSHRLAGALATAVIVGVLTRWPVAVLLAGAATWWLPTVLGRDHEHEHQLARIEAIASWVELLRDSLAAAAGIEQVIRSSAQAAPTPVALPVSLLIARLRRGRPLAHALRRFADDLGDPIGDLVVAALVSALEHQARDLTALLGTLAAAARDQAAMRKRIQAERARTRSSVRIITVTTLAMAAGLSMWAHPYLAPYGTAAGQGVLAAVGAVFALGFAWLSRASRLPTQPRILTSGAVG